MSAQHELDAAGVQDAQLRADYLHCRSLAATHGQTYFLATRLLPAARRPAIHALYGFARTVDDVVDEAGCALSVTERHAALDRFEAELSGGETSSEPVMRALADTSVTYGLNRQLFRDFLASMRMDLSISSYQSFAELETYMHGSAAVIGLQLLPVLGTVGPAERATRYAAELGVAFQLTNFIRDVGEDLRRGRLYLPRDSLGRFGVDREHLERGVVDEPVRALLRFEIARARSIYRRARPGIDLLEPAARSCVEVAYRLYGDILAAVEAADYQVLTGPRISVGRGRRLRVAGRGLLTASARAGEVAGSRLPHARRPNPR